MLALMKRDKYNDIGISETWYNVIQELDIMIEAINVVERK